MAELDPRKRTSGGGGSTTRLNEPGSVDPDRGSSQAQVSGAEAEEAGNRNRRAAQNTLTGASRRGFDTSKPEYADLQEVAETGFLGKTMGTVGMMLGWVDGGRQAMNLLMQDIAGGEAGEGERNPNAGDYWNALWGGVEDPEGFQIATGLNPISNSDTLDMFGWELADEDDFGARFLRGGGDFMLAILTDPLTYLTFGLGSVAKKAAMAGARAMQLDGINLIGKAVSSGVGKELLTTSYQKLLYSQRTELVQDFRDRLFKRQADNGGILPDHIRTSFRRTVGTDDITKMSDAKLLDLAVADRYYEDLLKHVAGRDFGKISSDIMDELPGYMRGGARINVPFVSGIKGGIQIPGTSGAGRKFVGDPFRKLRDLGKGTPGVADGIPGYERLIDKFEKATTQMNRSSPMIKAMREGGRGGVPGGIEGWQFHVLESAKDNLINRNANHEISTNLTAQWKEIDELATIAGVDTDIIGPDIWLRMEGQNIDDVMLRQMQELQGLDPDDLTGLQSGLRNVYNNADLDKSVNDMVTYMQEVMGEYHDALGLLDPNFKDRFIRGYIPHKTTDAGSQLVNALADSKVSIPTGRGNPAEDMAAAIVNSAGKGGVSDAAQGATGYVGRTHGRVQAHRVTKDGVDMLDEETLKLMNTEQLADGVITTDTRYIVTPELNRKIVPILEAQARKEGIPLPKDWDGVLYNDNPIEVMIDYVDNMAEAIEVWQHVDGLARAGLSARHSVEVDAQLTLQNMQGNAAGVIKDVKTTKFGRPVPGDRRAPTEWLGSITDGPSLSAARKSASRKNTLDDLASGIQGEVEVTMYQDGSVQVTKGADVVAAAQDHRIADLDIDWKLGREAEAPNGNGIGVGGQQKAGNFDPGFDDIGRHTTADLFEQTPWMGYMDEGPNLIGSKRQAVPGVPTVVHRELTDAGFTVKSMGDVEDLRELSVTARGNVSEIVEATPVRRPNHFEGVEEIPRAIEPGWHSVGPDHFLGDGTRVTMVAQIDDDVFRISLNPNLTEEGLNRAKWASVKFLDNQFANGALKGKLNNAGIASIVGDGLDAQSADVLHTYLRRKMGTLPPESMEFIAREPAEVFQARLLADDFTRKYREVINEHTALMDSEGNLIRGGTDATIAADSLLLQRLKALERAGRKAGDAGYEDIAAIMNDVTEYMGVSGGDGVKGMVNPGVYDLQGSAIDGLQIQQEMAQHLSLMARNSAMLNTPQGVAALKMAGKSWLKWWRGMATIPRPAFHIRNLVGGTHQNLVSGVTPLSMRRAAANTLTFRNTLRNAKGKGALEQAFKAVDSDVEAAFRTAWDEGVLNGFATTEFHSSLTPRQKRGRFDFWNVFDTDNFALTRAGARVMEGTEDFMRMSMFIEYFDEATPGSGKFAREMVNGTHFDYSDLTAFETKIKSIVPFYVWTRRNLPLQLRQAIEQPRIFQRYAAMMRAMNDNMGGDDPLNLEEADHFSAYAAGTDYKVNPETPFWARIMIDPDLPISDLLELDVSLGGSIDFVDNMIGPHLSLIQDLNSQREFGDVNAPTTLPGVMQSLAAVGFYDRTQDGDVRIPYWHRTLGETMVPFHRELFDPFGGPTAPNRQQRVGITSDDDFLTRSLKTVAAMTLNAAGFKTTTPADTRGAAYRDSEKTRQFIKELRLQGLLPDE